MVHLALVKVGRVIRPPHGLHYIASAVRAAGHTVHVHDESLVDSLEDSLEQILALKADVVGISVYSGSALIQRAKTISRAVKAASKCTTVVWGGWHPTLFSRESIQHKDVDVVVQGPGEKPTCKLLDALEQGHSAGHIPGLLFKENGRLIETGAACFDEHDIFPPLDYSLINIGAYLKRHDQISGTLSYVTSRGCYGRCSFCSTARVFKGRRFRKPKELIVRELELLTEQYAVGRIHFCDETAIANEAEAVDLCEIMRDATRSKSAKWRCDSRVDVLSSLSDKTYQELARSGCYGFCIGIESGAERVLKLMSKDITIAQIHTVLEKLSIYRIDHNLFFFIVGFPGETEEEALRTLKLACHTRLQFPLSNVRLGQYYSWTSMGIQRTEPMLNGKPSSLFKYYLSGSVQMGNNIGGMLSYVKRLYHKLLFLRVRCDCFGCPVEYYVRRLIRAFGVLLGWAAEFVRW